MRSWRSASRCGGSVTGEHGIGVEKIDFMPKLFTPEDLAMMLRLRSAFNPENRCSPRKMLPDRRGVHRAEQGGAQGGFMGAVRLPAQSPRHPSAERGRNVNWAAASLVGYPCEIREICGSLKGRGAFRALATDLAASQGPAVE